ncbi:MAG: excisionase [Burkholderiales bacterium]|nr:excisionase [Burkholderiales bacterium]
MSAAGQLIPLDTWAERRFPIRTPHVQTIRRWAREGKIHPAPQKHGRAYYVSPNAEYLSDEQLVQRLTRDTPAP